MQEKRRGKPEVDFSVGSVRPGKLRKELLSRTFQTGEEEKSERGETSFGPKEI